MIAILTQLPSATVIIIIILTSAVGLKSGGTNSGLLGHIGSLTFQPTMVGSGKKAVSRPKVPRAGVCSWRGGKWSPPNQLEGSPSGVWDAAPAEIEFGAF